MLPPKEKRKTETSSSPFYGQLSGPQRPEAPTYLHLFQNQVAWTKMYEIVQFTENINALRIDRPTTGGRRRGCVPGHIERAGRCLSLGQHRRKSTNGAVSVELTEGVEPPFSPWTGDATPASPISNLDGTRLGTQESGASLLQTVVRTKCNRSGNSDKFDCHITAVAPYNFAIALDESPIRKHERHAVGQGFVRPKPPNARTTGRDVRNAAPGGVVAVLKIGETLRSEEPPLPSTSFFIRT
jgi:hypothetical protein